jgi:hypothetical protein
VKTARTNEKARLVPPTYTTAVTFSGGTPPYSKAARLASLACYKVAAFPCNRAKVQVFFYNQSVKRIGTPVLKQPGATNCTCRIIISSLWEYKGDLHATDSASWPLLIIESGASPLEFCISAWQHRSPRAGLVCYIYTSRTTWCLYAAMIDSQTNSTCRLTWSGLIYIL